ncbi:MAG: hypothetical protein IPK17_25155 [Chloroflexi bacterium]|uniref:B3/B4 domain-containing protein n=1 Tax=Candidatus Flexifilum breve TaxID=3140694 RepID=UPI003136DA70|nr:hypothetical protein [Chloroflexota bacterium]
MSHGIGFAYSPEIHARYPQLVGGVIFASGLRNGATPPDLLALYQAEQAAVKGRIGDTPLSEIKSLAAWRSVFRSFGVDPTQTRSACEALLRRLTKQGDIPSINALVDMGNLISIRYGLPVAVLDVARASGTITVRFADGTERFTNLGQAETVAPESGEVIFADDTGTVFARRWCWRQSDESAAREATTDVIITIEGQHADAESDVTAAIRDLTALLAQYAGGEITNQLYK